MNVLVLILCFSCSCLFVAKCQFKDETSIKIGFVFEESDLDSVELESALEVLRTQIGDFDFVLKSYFSRDSYTILQQTCRALREGAAFIIAQASCSSTNVIQTLTHSLQVPALFLPKFSSCSKIPEVSSTSFPMRVSNSLVYNRLGSILAKNDWNNYLIMHDEYFAESYITELNNELKKSVDETKRGMVASHVIKLYDIETTKDMQSTLIDLNTNGLFSNFIVLASQKNTLRLLKQAQNLGLFGLSYKWVLANIDLDLTQFHFISPQFNALMIIRQLPLSAFDRSSGFVEPKWDGTSSLGISRNMSYILNAAQLAIEALNSTYSSEKTNYGQVKNLNCMKDSQFNDGPKIIDRVKRTKKLEDGSYDYFGVANDYLGVSYFKKSQIFDGNDKNFDSIRDESRFEVFPHLEMLRYDTRSDMFLAGWKRVDTYNAYTFNPTWHLPENVSPFRVGKTSLDGSTLKVSFSLNCPIKYIQQS